MTKLSIVTLTLLALTGCRNHHGKHHDPSGSSAQSEAQMSIPDSVKTNCLSCHTISAKHEPTQAIAPPLFAVKSHLKEFEQREAFIEHVVAWVKAPNAEQARMRGAVKKFGLMPALTIEDSEIEQIAAWLYDTPMKKPDWYAKHYQKEHGKKPSE